MEGIYNLLISIEEITNIILKSADIDISDDIGKRISCYLFMILYKLFSFINHYDEFGEGSYLKDRLSFASRHHNIDLYYRIQDLLTEYYPGITAYSLFENKIILELYVSKIQKTPSRTQSVRNKDGGNPIVSIISYIEYIEERNSDWLVDNGYDVYSTTFPLNNDEILIENRNFLKELILHMYNMKVIENDEDKVSFTLGELLKLIEFQQQKKITKNKSKSKKIKKSTKNKSKKIKKSTKNKIKKIKKSIGGT